MSQPITNRYDFMLIFDVKDGNPNGDPDAGNLPRIDPETGEGLVTDVCLKRKVRNYVQIVKGSEPPYDIFIKEKGILNNMIAEAYKAIGVNLEKDPENPEDGKKRKDKTKGQGSEVESARQQMCKTYYDIRTFGAVMSTGANAGQVRGPIQLTFARSEDPIVTLEHSITRMAVATTEEAEKQGGDNRTMGRKNTVPYGIYTSYGFISPHLAAQTGFDEDDLELFWNALVNMFEHDHSAARGMMSTCKLVIFKHDSALGNAASKTLFETVKIARKDENSPPRDSDDYNIDLPDDDDLPPGVTMIVRP